MKAVDKVWLWSYAIKVPLIIDLYIHGPISTFLSAVTGLPIE